MARKNDILSIYTKEVEQIKADGLFKGEAPFVSPQGAKVVMEDGRELLNMCANNYLGLGDSQRLMQRRKLMMKKDMGLLLSDLSAEHRTSTKNWKRRFPDFWEQMIRFYILPALMQMVDFLKQS